MFECFIKGLIDEAAFYFFMDVFSVAFFDHFCRCFPWAEARDAGFPDEGVDDFLAFLGYGICGHLDLEIGKAFGLAVNGDVHDV